MRPRGRSTSRRLNFVTVRLFYWFVYQSVLKYGPATRGVGFAEEIMPPRSLGRSLLAGFLLALAGEGISTGADLVTVSAASYRAGPVAAESIVSAFGLALARTPQSADRTPLPTMLAGITVTVTDSAGTSRPAPLFFVSPLQVNYLVPPGTRPGPATVTISGEDWHSSAGSLQVEEVAPGLFAANGNGQGVAAAAAVRVSPHGLQTAVPVFRFDGAQRRAVPVPIGLGDAGDQVILSLFGTGVRSRSADAAVSVTIGGETAEVLSAGPQSQFVGLDQVNVRLPRSLLGRGPVEIVLSVDGKAANPVTVEIR